MRSTIRTSVIALVFGMLVQGAARAHCEIPCGIFGDEMRIAMLLEDITTIEKSMTMIDSLYKEDPINVNQLVRWVVNKEEHANKVQEIVTQYWLTQRIKLPAEGDAAAQAKYVGQLSLLHSMLVHAAKAKQTTDLANVAALRRLVTNFAATYFTPEALEHLKEHHGFGE